MNKNITLAEVITQRDKLESYILEAISSFERETGINVREIKLTQTQIMGSPAPLTNSVSVPLVIT